MHKLNSRCGIQRKVTACKAGVYLGSTPFRTSKWIGGQQKMDPLKELLDMRPDVIVWAFWKEVPGIEWEEAELLDPEVIYA